MAPTIERIGSGCTGNLMRVLVRLTAPPSDMIDQIGGWKSINGVGVGYVQGYDLGQLRAWLVEHAVY